MTRFVLIVLASMVLIGCTQKVIVVMPDDPQYAKLRAEGLDAGEKKQP